MALTLVCLEVSVRLLNLNAKIEYLFDRPMSEPDGLLGYKNRPNVQVRATKKKDGQLLFDVRYSTDEHGRRSTPVQGGKRTRRFMLFFGCSFTFGEGVGDDETLPSRVSKLAPDYMVYNYGVGGYGPQYMPMKLASSELPNELLGGGDGIFVYTFIDHHIPRVIGWMSIMEYGSSLPYYQLDEKGQLARRGSFMSGRPVVTDLYLAMWKSQLVRYVTSLLRLPRIRDQDVMLTAKLIEESRNIFRERFQSERFYVLFYPHDANFTAGRLIPYLQKAGIKYLDYSNLTDPDMIDKIPQDPHPSARSYRAVAAKLARDLGVSKEGRE